VSSVINFFPASNPIQGLNETLKARMMRAQADRFEKEFRTAADLCARVLGDLRIALKVPARVKDMAAGDLADRPLSKLRLFYFDVLKAAGVPEQAITLQAANLAQRTHLVRAFSKPDDTLQFIEDKVLEIVARFPKTPKDIECGKNPGDVIDPYILSATQHLLFGGKMDLAVGATVSHKASMMIEGLLGHLHEDVIGEMRGNMRAPEPRSGEQEKIDVALNPFPGADVVQPPSSKKEVIRFHQIKSKTGSAKGGDGKRLGDQLRRLQETYGGEIFYDALIGNTLRGHRSRAGVETAAPSVIVLVGNAAFKALTRSAVGPELLLRVYQAAFVEASRKSGYRVEELTAVIVSTFKKRAEEHGEGFLENILNAVTQGPLEQQDSRLSSRGL
jgi:hypothetical protein